MSGAADSVQASALAAEAWLRTLDFPRPNGSAFLDSAKASLQSMLTEAGLEPQALPFVCRPDRNVVDAVMLLLSGLLLILALHRRRRGFLAGVVGLWCAAAMVVAGICDPLLPGSRQDSLWLRVDSRGAPHQEILLVSHYDSKSEPLDHVGRSLLLAVAIVSCAGAWLAVHRRRRHATWLVCVALLALVGLAAQLSLGRWLPRRSAGIVDDAGACVLLADLASDLQQRPLQQTQVAFLWTSGEEVGAQGATAAAQSDVLRESTCFINFEGIGAGPDLAVSMWELEGWRLGRSDETTRTSLRRCAVGGLRTFPFPLWSDAGALQRAGLPGATLLNLEHGATTIRGLHGPQDRLERFDWRGYAASRALLRCVLVEMDGRRPAP